MQNSNKGNNTNQDDLSKGNNTNHDDLSSKNFINNEYDSKDIKQQISDLDITSKKNPESDITNIEKHDSKDIKQQISDSDITSKKNPELDITNIEKHDSKDIKQQLADKKIVDPEKIRIDDLDSAKEKLNERDAKILVKSIQDNFQKSAPILPRDDLVELKASLVFVDQSQDKAQDLSRLNHSSKQEDQPSSEFKSRSVRKASSCLPKPCTIS